MTTSRRPSKRHVIALVVLGAILVVGIVAALTLLGFREGKAAFDKAHVLRAKNTALNVSMAIESFFDPGTPVLGRRAISWSSGPDGQANRTDPGAPENNDNVYSWK